MNKLSIVVFAVVAALVCACSMSQEPEPRLQPNPLDADSGPDTPPDERITDLLQEAKQQYDDAHYETSLRMSEKAVALINEHEFPLEDKVLAIAIQGYSLLQLGYLEDYFVETHGVQSGAITKFRKALSFKPDSFRAQLGIGLALFRRHGDSIIKAEALGEGIIFLESLREDAARGFKKDDSAESKRRLRMAGSKFTTFKANRRRLLELGYVFRDPSTIDVYDNRPETEAVWLGSLSEAQAELATHDIEGILDDAENGVQITAPDIELFNKQISAIADSWGKARKYWRQRGLTDLQESRDRLLEIRKKRVAANDGRLDYFWIDRDLTFVFQSLGAFFLDSGLERARKAAIANGTTDSQLESKAQQIYLRDDFDNWQKRASLENYKAALSYTENFIRRHRQFERLRLDAIDEAYDADDENTNPFLVDLVSRYRNTMDQLIEEERGIRKQMVLEAAAMCIDPLFQINDMEKAVIWSDELKSMDTDNPLHHFVRATAYFEGEEWELALAEYEAFLRDSSITSDSMQRSRSRTRIMQCNQYIDRQAGAGEDDRR